MQLKIKETINSLPRTSGVYLFYSKPTPNTKHLTPIYIGKAINLRDRVKNHFMQPTYKDAVFISTIKRIEFIETGSEIEALVLEASLIKKHLPKFNVVWKDGKNYFFVAIANNRDGIPYVFITHQPREIQNAKIKNQNDNAKSKISYVGPFVEGAPLKKTLKYLRRVFPFYTTARHPDKKCTWCHLELCPGSNPDLIEYKKNLKKLALILQGKRKTVLFALRREMAAFSNSREFENAAKTRNQITALEQVMSHVHVIESQNPKVKNQNWPATEKLLQKIIGVSRTTISRIECYDISNIQGKNAVGSMVVFVNGAPDKSQYKKFSIRLADAGDTNLRMTSESTNDKRKRRYDLVENKPNDIAMLKQVLQRRLTHPEWEYPQVMLIDGGIAQLNIAVKVIKLSSYKVKSKVISIAKGKQELLIEGKPKIPLKNLPQEIYNLVKHLDDEAHRFAITYHKKLRKKQLLS